MYAYVGICDRVVPSIVILYMSSRSYLHYYQLHNMLTLVLYTISLTWFYLYAGCHFLAHAITPSVWGKTICFELVLT